MIWISLLLSGCVMGSGLAVWALNLRSRFFLNLLLGFSGAFLIGISFTHLLPEVYEAHSIYVGFFVLLGFLLQLFLELLTKGAEHGHQPDAGHSREPESHRGISPWLLMIGLSIHSFLEGMPISNAFDSHLRHTLLAGIIIHKIPIAITLFALFLHDGIPLKRTFFLLFLFSLMTPLGILTSWGLQESLIFGSGQWMRYIMAIVVGIFLHVATSILYETDKSHQYNYQKFLSVILGLATAILVALAGHGH